VLLGQLAAIAELPATLRPAALIVAPAVARAAPGLLGRLFPPARSEGLGATFGAGLGRGGALAGVGLAVGTAALVLGSGGVVAAGVALALALALGAFMTGRLGGVTGDVHGAGVEVAELAVLATVAAWAHARP
jgi:cobalamin synthase